MSLEELYKELKKKDKDVEIRSDTFQEFRVFIYSQKQKYPITSYLDRSKSFEIIKISDYPRQEYYPICVVRVKRLRKKRNDYKSRRNTKSE